MILFLSLFIFVYFLSESADANLKNKQQFPVKNQHNLTIRTNSLKLPN